MLRVFTAAAGVVLALVAVGLLRLVTSDQPLQGPDMTWLTPYAQVVGVLGGAVCLASAMLLIGLSFGRWRHPEPDPGAPERT